MFSVFDKEKNCSVTVYDVTYDAVTGYPQFLVYDGAWKRVSAKHYEPETPTVEDLVRRYFSDSRFLQASENYDALEDQISDWEAYCRW